MIDTHAHIDTEAFDNDRAEMLERASKAGVRYVIVPATEIPTFSRLIQVVESDERLYFAAGIHPHSAAEVRPEDLITIEEAAKRDKCVAIGEIGLDYYYDFSPKEIQRDVFRAQLEMASRLKLPVIIHNRDSDEDLLSILGGMPEAERPKGVLHCFSGGIEFLEKALELGFYISYTGNITFKKTNLNEAVARTPNDRIMLETDSPYMTPVPHRGKRNEPSLIGLVAEKIAGIKQITIDEVVKMTTENAQRLFKLGLILFILAGLSPALSFAAIQADEEEQGETIQEEIMKNPYHKFIGFGPVFGTNTIVTSYTPALDQEDVSEEGMFTIGGALVYSPFDYLVLEASYVVSKNDRIAKLYTVNPNYHRVLDLSSHWIVNPYGRVNFFGTLGYSYLFNTYSSNTTGRREDIVDEDINQSSLNAGIGFYVNVPTESIGMFSFSAEWRLNFVLTKQKLDHDPRKIPPDPAYFRPVEMTMFFSIPRLTVLYYPSFL